MWSGGPELSSMRISGQIRPHVIGATLPIRNRVPSGTPRQSRVFALARLVHGKVRLQPTSFPLDFLFAGVFALVLNAFTISSPLWARVSVFASKEASVWPTFCSPHPLYSLLPKLALVIGHSPPAAHHASGPSCRMASVVTERRDAMYRSGQAAGIRFSIAIRSNSTASMQERRPRTEGSSTHPFSVTTGCFHLAMNPLTVSEHEPSEMSEPSDSTVDVLILTFLLRHSDISFPSCFGRSSHTLTCIAPTNGM